MFTAQHAHHQTIDTAHVVERSASTLHESIAVDPASAPSPEAPASRRAQLLTMRWNVDSTAGGRLVATWIAA